MYVIRKMYRRWLTIALAVALPAAAQENPVKWSLEAPRQARPGEKIAARLTATVTEGWHLYSLKKLEGGPYPTSITVPEGQPFRLAGEIEAPAPVTVKDEAFDMEVEMYFGEAAFVVPVEVAKDAAAGDAKLVVAARFQVCDNKLCLPPRTVRSEATVRVGAK
jgi:thiol:disulfide interchange protein DsbD